ncbi:MAG: penicillin acylase family protein [Proteobacteria bacterium]|nr:penicillin acylase family protein [Pseudomonadota bacterium]TDJ36160.1 MAG: hypothetical protein E2O53_04415 [Gammaproteobacteria bacterium]
MRFLRQLVTWSVISLVVVALMTYLTLRGSLPQLDGHLGADHIRAAVLIERDAAGILVIAARNRSDSAFATGFVHGQDQFAVAPGDQANGCLHMPGGQSGHPLSDYYSRGHDDRVEGRATAFPPGEPVHTLTLTPGNSLN